MSRQATDQLQIVPAVSPEQFGHVRDLFSEYIAWDCQVASNLGFDANILLQFQYHQGVIELPGEYAPPDGRLLMALYESQVAGCGALQRFDEQSCEVKRMYARPVFRGKKVGRRLLETLIRDARAIGYTCAKIETVSFIQEAQALYRSFGFEYVEPYYEIPDEFKPITLFMELKLS